MFRDDHSSTSVHGSLRRIIYQASFQIKKTLKILAKYLFKCAIGPLKILSRSWAIVSVRYLTALHLVFSYTALVLTCVISPALFFTLSSKLNITANHQLFWSNLYYSYSDFSFSITQEYVRILFTCTILETNMGFKSLSKYKFLLQPHYFCNLILAASFFILKEVPYVCHLIFGTCEYEMVRA